MHPFREDVPGWESGPTANLRSRMGRQGEEAGETSMRIKSASIRNYKSIEQADLRDLDDMVVLHGENNVGKSNLLQALSLPFELLDEEMVFVKQQESGLQRPLVSRKAWIRKREWLRERGQCVRVRAPKEYGSIDLTLELDRGQCEVARSRLGAEFLSSDTGELHIGVTFNQPVREALLYEVTHLELNGEDLLKWKPALEESKIEWFLAAYVCQRFIRVGPWRQFRKEIDEPPLALMEQEFPRQLDEKIKRYLFAFKNSGAYRNRFDMVVDTLARLSSDIGRLDIVREPDKELEVYIDGPAGRLPIANLGSGYQQAALMLSWILLSGASTVIIEEPEMNLSWESQKLLRELLQGLVEDPEAPVDQVIVSAHSRFFKGGERWLEVSQKEGITSVVPVSYDQRQPPFDVGDLERVRGIRLTRYGQIPLPQELVEDLGLQPNDPVYVIKNEETGRWEIRSEDEIDRLIFDEQPGADGD